MNRLAWTFALAIVVMLPATPALGQSAWSGDEILYAVLPVTPEQARELQTLLQSPGTIANDLLDATEAVVDVVPTLPAALLHDVVTTPVRDWHVLRGVVTDAVELVSRPSGERHGLFRHTLRALHRSQVFAAATRIVRRVTRPTNRTARLAIVLTARGQGIPARGEHLDMLSRAIDRDDPDLGPLVVGVADILARKYGRDAVRLILR
jgi:hypothetical protein